MVFRRKVAGKRMVPTNGSKTVLFAYREGAFQEFVSALLTVSGHNLITAIGGADGLRRAGAFDGAIHLLLAGVELPGMTGTELAIQLNRERPGTKILLISELDAGILVLNKDWQFMPKPFMAKLLQNTIRDSLSDRELPGEHVPPCPATGKILSGVLRSAKTVLLVKGQGVRQSAARSLHSADCHLIVGGSGADALQKAGEFDGPIHMLVANLDLSDMTGIELSQRLNQERPDTKVLLFSTLDSGTLILGYGWHFLPAPFESGMLNAKVLDILGKPTPANQECAPQADAGPGPEKLSNREIQILKLIAAGNSTKQAAERMGIAFKTAAGHRYSLMKKLGIHDTVALVHYAIRGGLIDA